MDRKAKTQPKLPITDREADDRRMAVTENAEEILLPFSIREEERDQEKDHVNLQTVIRFLTTTDPFLVLVEKLRRKVQPQLITPQLPPPEILNGNQRGEQKDMELSRYSAVKEALRKRILKGIPGGEFPLKPGMTRVRWTCVNIPSLDIQLCCSLMITRSAIVNTTTTSMKLDLEPFRTCRRL